MPKEASTRVKAEQVQVKKDCRSSIQRKTKRIVLRLVMTYIRRLKDISMASYGRG